MEQTEKLRIVSKYLGDYSPRSSTNVALACPFCNHHKKKLEIELSSGLWNCWVCKSSGNTLTKLLRKVSAESSDIAKISKLENTNVRFEKSTDENVSLPSNFIPFDKCIDNFYTNRLRNYLKSRNTDSIVIPSYDSSFNLNYYISKNIVTNKYNNPKCSKDKVFLESIIDWSHDIVIVEGIFDAIAVKRNAIPLFGKFLNDKVKERIVSSSCQNFYIALDGGELDSILKIAKYVLDVGKNPYFVNMPVGEDPSSLGTKNVWEYINNSNIVTENDIYRYKLFSKINM
jgi:transcription elongation factor Elf1